MVCIERPWFYPSCHHPLEARVLKNDFELVKCYGRYIGLCSEAILLLEISLSHVSRPTTVPGEWSGGTNRLVPRCVEASSSVITAVLRSCNVFRLSQAVSNCCIDSRACRIAADGRNGSGSTRGARSRPYRLSYRARIDSYVLRLTMIKFRRLWFHVTALLLSFQITENPPYYFTKILAKLSRKTHKDFCNARASRLNSYSMKRVGECVENVRREWFRFGRKNIEWSISIQFWSTDSKGIAGLVNTEYRA